METVQEERLLMRPRRESVHVSWRRARNQGHLSFQAPDVR